MKECAQDSSCPLSLLFLPALSIVCECAICVCVCATESHSDGSASLAGTKIVFSILEDPSKGPAGQSISRDSACVCV